MGGGKKQDKVSENASDSEGEEAGESQGVTNAWNMPVPKFKKGDMRHGLVEMTSFSVNFPEYREHYLKKSLPILEKIMKEHNIKVLLDSPKGQISVITTKDTWDPYAIMLARDVIKLISRHVSIEKAVRVFDEGITSEIMKIKGICRDKEIFIKRRNRLLGRDCTTLLALEQLTDCSVTVQGGTVAIIGPYKGVLKVMSVVKDCMSNVHPLHLLNTLHLQKAFSEDPTLKDEDWSQLLPVYKAKTARKKKKTKKEKKPYNPLPPPQIESKMDKEMEEGSYFLTMIEKKKKQSQQDKEQQRAKSDKIQAEKRALPYVPPEEPVAKKAKVQKSEEVDIQKLKKKVRDQKKVKKTKKKSGSV
ncbi:K domain type 1 [Trinorchestia longiramus]|nr:K domain type 1 [Trinorchestia longiramus]